MAFQIRLIKESDANQITELFKDSFKQPMCQYDSNKFFLWFYFANVFKKNYTQGIYEGNMLLSYWGFIPIAYIENNNICKGSFSLQLVSQKINLVLI